MLDSALAETAADGGRTALLRGPAGAGKSTLLAAAVAGWRARDVQVITVRGTGDPGDPFGFRPVVHAVREQFEHLGGARLAQAIGQLSRLCARPPAPAQLVRLALELAGLFEIAAAGRPTVLAVDDADRLPAPAALALDAAARAGYLVVAACRDGADPGAVRLRSAADLVVDLGDLPEEAVASVIARSAAAPPTGGLLAALRSALGPLAGHPGTIVDTVSDLVRAGHLVVRRGAGGRGRLCLADPAVPIALPAGHALVAGVRALGPVAVRLTAMAAGIRFGVTDLPLLADATRGDADHYGRVADRLLADGSLRAGADGTLAVPCPALAARLALDIGPSALARLHRVYAAAILRRFGHGEAADPAALADHVSSAGVTIPADPRTAVQLRDVATELGDAEPDRAAGWLRAALWHAGDGPAAHRIVTQLLRLLVRAGRYAALAEVVDRVAANGVLLSDPGQRDDLATAAMLAAVHTAAPVPAPTARALASDPRAGRAQLSFCARWFALAGQPTVVPPGRRGDERPLDRPHRSVEPLLSAAELDQLNSAIWLDQGPGPADPVLLAGSVGDLATVLRLVVGERYGMPAEGPLATYRRLLAAYAAGDFDATLSDARELELGPLTPVSHLAQLLAGEVRGLRGDTRAAADHLAAVPDTPPYQASRWWTGCAANPAAAAAVRDGWRAYLRQLDSGCRIGTEHTLVRLATLAVHFGQRGTAAEVLTEVEAGGAAGHRVSAETALLVRAAVLRDHAAAWTGAQLARARGHLPDLVHACLLAAELADDPEPWLHEAYETARPFGSPRLRGRIAAMMRERGIRAPRARPAQQAFSPVELRIVELVRAGCTNRQIAARVRLSEKSVENHLTRLFARAGCRSRAELAAVAERGPWLGAAS
jgi:DNA-binding CsgD family transcriptional regulator